jgi:hypothetical protein
MGVIPPAIFTIPLLGPPYGQFSHRSIDMLVLLWFILSQAWTLLSPQSLQVS